MAEEFAWGVREDVLAADDGEREVAKLERRLGSNYEVRRGTAFYRLPCATESAMGYGIPVRCCVHVSPP